MDIKLKKSRPFLVWLCFFIGFNIIATFLLLGICFSNELYQSRNEFKAILQSDIKEREYFKRNIGSKFRLLMDYVTDEGEGDDESQQIDELGNQFDEIEIPVNNKESALIDELDSEGENLLYYAINTETGKNLTNVKNDLGMSVKGFPLLPEGYDYSLYFNGKELVIEKKQQPVDIYRNDSGYRETPLGQFMDRSTQKANSDSSMENIRIFLIVKSDIIENPYDYSSLYQLQRDTVLLQRIFMGLLCVGIISILLLIFSILNWDDKKKFDKKLVGISRALWLEIKGFLSVIILFFLILSFETTYEGMISIILIIASTWWFYIIGLDLFSNPRRFFSHHSINSLLRYYRNLEGKKPFQKAMITRVYWLVGVESILIILAVFFFLAGIVNYEATLMMMAFLIIGIGIYLLYRYLKNYGKLVHEMGKVVDQIEAIKEGNVTITEFLDKDGDLYFIEENLNKIQEGIIKAAEERIKSERMKIELITNVSHDLKTPLTSIISYVDLLSKEEELPEHVKDYIKILNLKSEKLKTLIQDIFDLSKASSGNMEFQRERLDLSKLIQQTLADLNEEILNSELTFKVNTPDEPLYIMSDGNKLYRVFLNLISNALKYSLKDSRVYIDLELMDNRVIAIIKNTAKYEINFSEAEILERFVRGDKSRSTEGSGLGLAIAQSFTQACGGTFELKVDGDLFKVILSFAAAK